MRSLFWLYGYVFFFGCGTSQDDKQRTQTEYLGTESLDDDISVEAADASADKVIPIQLPAGAADNATFGSEADVFFSKVLWSVMVSRELAVNRGTFTLLKAGGAPHGAIVEVLQTTFMVGEEKGQALIKYNYGGDGITLEQVDSDRATWLQAITVMFKRFAGYDNDHQDYFWVKYHPEGRLFTNEGDIPLAGRIGKNEDKGCIPCHQGAAGDDYLFANDF